MLLHFKTSGLSQWNALYDYTYILTHIFSEKRKRKNEMKMANSINSILDFHILYIYFQKQILNNIQWWRTIKNVHAKVSDNKWKEKIIRIKLQLHILLHLWKWILIPLLSESYKDILICCYHYFHSIIIHAANY